MRTRRITKREMLETMYKAGGFDMAWKYGDNKEKLIADLMKTWDRDKIVRVYNDWVALKNK